MIKNINNKFINILKTKKMTKQEFSKTIKIYKSHKLANSLISVTYASILSNNAISTEKTVEIEDKGGALTSLYFEKVGENANTEIKRTSRTLTVKGLKFSIKKYFDIMEDADVEDVLFQNGMMVNRSMNVDDFIEMVKDYNLMKSRNGYFLEPKGNKHVDNEIYPVQ